MGIMQFLAGVCALLFAWVIISIFNLDMRFWLWSDTWQATCFLTSLIMYYQACARVRENLRSR